MAVSGREGITNVLMISRHFLQHYDLCDGIEKCWLMWGDSKVLCVYM